MDQNIIVQECLEILREARSRMMATGNWNYFPEVSTDHVVIHPDGESFFSFTEENAMPLFVPGKKSFILNPLFIKELNDILVQIEKEKHTIQKLKDLCKKDKIDESVIVKEDDLGYLVTPDEDLSWLTGEKDG